MAKWLSVRTAERGFILKRVRDMTRTYEQNKRPELDFWKANLSWYKDFILAKF